MDRESSFSDATLLAAAGREPEAFAAFYRRHERLVLRYQLVRTRDPELAADLAAETFAGALEFAASFDSVRAGGDSAIPWLLTIARNVLGASIRRGAVAEEARRRLELEPIVLDDGDLERIGSLGIADPTLHGLLDSLPVEQREALVARVFDERDYEEIAGQLGCSALVVRKRVSRGLSRLRSALAASQP